MNSITSLSSTPLPPVVTRSLQDSGLTSGAASSTPDCFQPPDSSRLSRFAQVLSGLQQLQESNPVQYRDVAKQIAANLDEAAKTAESQGDTTRADQLKKLASDFTAASESGELPDIQDLARVMGGGHHRRHHGHHRVQSAGSTADGSQSQTLLQLFGGQQGGEAQNSALDPETIILNTLASAGISAA